MTAQASSDVNAALDERAHYLQHPSGLRQSEVAELFPYHLGSALKYVWRHAHKGDPAFDLEKALWHLDRELGRLPAEHDESRQHLGLGKDAGPSTLSWSSARTRITDRLRPLRQFAADKELVAVIALWLAEYRLADARALLLQHLKRYRAEGTPTP